MIRKYDNFKILILACLIIMVTAIFSCTNNPKILSLSITSPENGATLESNLLKVTGQVSPAEASVQIKNTIIKVNSDGLFYTYIDLAEGINTFNVTAALAGEKVIKKISVTFEKPLVLFLDEPEPVPGLDYTQNPFTLTGSVTYPEAKVTADGNEASVKPDGSYSVTIQLKRGQNIINLKAELGNKQDLLNYSIEVGLSGELSYPSPLMTGKSMLFFGNVNVKIGETTSIDVLLKVGRDIRTPIRYSQKISFDNESFSGNNVPTPEGLQIYIEPNSFLIYPGVQYIMTLNINTSGNLMPGTYFLKLENFLNDNKWAENHSTLTVNR